MDGVSTGVVITQAAGYILALLKTLSEVCEAVKYGSTILQNYRTDIGDLIFIVTAIGKKSSWVKSSPLTRILLALEATSQRLLKLLRGTSRMKVGFTLLIRREEINKHFISLERQKSTLLLHISTETSFAVDAMVKNEWPFRRLPACLKKLKQAKVVRPVVNEHPAPHCNMNASLTCRTGLAFRR